MPKRQTETKIWSTQRWYRKLHPYHKLAWKYLTDCCDHAGIWKIDYGQLVEDTGIEEFNLAQFVEACNTDFDKETGERIFRERILMVGKGILWLTGFIRFQYENKDFQVNPEVPVIKSALQILNGYGILNEALDKGYITLSKPFATLSKPTRTHIEEPVEERDIKNDAIAPGMVGNAPENLTTNPPEPLNNPSEPFVNPSEGDKEGIERTKYKEHNTPPLESKSKFENSQQSNPEVSEKVGNSQRWESDVGLCWNLSEYLAGHEAIFHSFCMTYHERYNQLQITAITEKYHLWLTKKDEYPQKPAQLLAGLHLWLKNEKNFEKNGTGKTSGNSHGKSAGTAQLIQQLGAELDSRGKSNPSG